MACPVITPQLRGLAPLVHEAENAATSGILLTDSGHFVDNLAMGGLETALAGSRWDADGATGRRDVGAMDAAKRAKQVVEFMERAQKALGDGDMDQDEYESVVYALTGVEIGLAAGGVCDVARYDQATEEFEQARDDARKELVVA